MSAMNPDRGSVRGQITDGGESMAEFTMRAEVLKYLKTVDKMLYGYHRDYRVSGLPLDNKANKAWVVRCEALLLSTERFLASIHEEASKDHRTGDAKP